MWPSTKVVFWMLAERLDAAWVSLRVMGVTLSGLLLCVLVACGLAYPVYLLSDGGIGIRAAISRGSLLLMLLGLWWVSRSMKLTPAELGVRVLEPACWKMAYTGWMLGFIMLAIHSLIVLLLDIRALDMEKLADGTRVLRGLSVALATGMVVSVIEELLFRAVMLAAFARYVGRWLATLMSAFIYASLHFFRFDPRNDPVNPDVYSGFNLLPDAFSHLLHAPMDSWLALFCAGILLATIRWRVSCGLYCCIGLHAGWVFVIKFVKPLTHNGPDPTRAFLLGPYDGLTGYLATVWMLLLVILNRKWARQ
ncbi:MAG: CPBP family intramembrane glutamic endopeptidase [Methylococcaceae bacterium]